MTKITILNDTFAPLGQNEYGNTIGTVQVDLGFGRVVTAKAYPNHNGGHSVAGFVGRYVTSDKAWSASVDGKGDSLYVHFGRDDRSGRFNKQNAIRWEPELYASLTNPKFWAVA